MHLTRLGLGAMVAAGAIAATATAASAHPDRNAVTAANLTDGQHVITGLRIGADGSLTTVGATGSLLAGTIGTAAS